MFPLFSIAILAIAISFVTELYTSIVILNSILLFIISTEQVDFSVWFLFYEISLLTGFTTLTLESRSYRRLYAFAVMLCLTLISSSTFYVLLSDSISNSSSLILVVLCCFIVFVKVPTFPFSIWLPEAHVEASWPGSVVLAAYALKFSVAISVVLLWKAIPSFSFLVVLTVFSTLYAALSMSATSDSKKLVACFSILHMSATITLLVLPINVEFLVNFSWHHHSLVTGWIFCLIGWAYATSSSRIFRLLFLNSFSLPIAIAILFSLATFSLDLPWSSNIFVELGYISSAKSNYCIAVILCLYFWVFMIAILISTTSRNSTLNGNVDLSVLSSTLWILSIVIVSTIGFGIARSCM